MINLVATYHRPIIGMNGGYSEVIDYDYLFETNPIFLRKSVACLNERFQPMLAYHKESNGQITAVFIKDDHIAFSRWFFGDMSWALYRIDINSTEFNILKEKEGSCVKDLESILFGIRGIHILHSITDSFNYLRRLDPSNKLTDKVIDFINRISKDC